MTLGPLQQKAPHTGFRETRPRRAVLVLGAIIVVCLGWSGYQISRLPDLHRQIDSLQKEYRQHQTLPYDLLRALERETGLHDWSLSDEAVETSASVILGDDETLGPDGAQRLGSSLATVFPGYHVIVEERRTDAEPSTVERRLTVSLERSQPEPRP